MLNLGNVIGDGSKLAMTPEERRQGTYIIGTTGTGKSTLLRNIIFQDMHPEKKHGLCLIDPHGELIDEILGMVPNSWGLFFKSCKIQVVPVRHSPPPALVQFWCR